MAILAHLIQIASSLPTDVSALESSISALESKVAALESSSVPWEHRLPWFTGAVALGVALEFWVLRDDRREDMHAWRRGIICWPPARPSLVKYIVEIVSILLVTGGIVLELWAGVRITEINGLLRGDSAELRSDSDRLLILLNVKASKAAALADDVSGRAGKLSDKLTEDEQAEVALKRFL
jgi:hypothetical protein